MTFGGFENVLPDNQISNLIGVVSLLKILQVDSDTIISCKSAVLPVYNFMCVPSYRLHIYKSICIFELLTNHFLNGDRSHGSRHVAGKCMVRCSTWYRQPVAKNVYMAESGAALVPST